jgi:hypothetical protein
MLFDHLVHFVFLWYTFPVSVSRSEKNLAALVRYEKNLATALKRSFWFVEKNKMAAAEVLGWGPTAHL